MEKYYVYSQSINRLIVHNAFQQPLDIETNILSKIDNGI